ncbi:THOC5 protein [Schizosaccharomyces pombe]|uniref:THO complex subunit tho5 n=1 Tax=Schizosaccharomyces pombe (strain 972 / ATCC 24843) TaxID=284812 RepID=THOC5_SCHPO|nr:THOC5-like protein [Schizosaccharomyces pombe]Q9USR5.1 RecName: Full=THO complex subunit tho5 [Schizosaccharomyces pombe 972h-]CAB54812.1 human THOC5 ortholog (predicted) [Schizosaccharomyces pombe]|eukprot:NP_595302.1 THOC5-like protein [Schizosaccharomyces pombe]
MTENAISDCLNVLDSTRTLCLRIHELKQHSRDADDQNPEQIKRQLMSKLLILREANRKSYEQLVQAKTITAEHKSELDNARIRLQALQYKKLHLKTIIKNYEEKEHIYTALPLVSKEEFLKEHPEFKSSNDHDLMLAILEDELKERQRLSTLKQELLKRKAALISENKAKRNALQKGDEKLQTFLRSSVPVQEYYNITSM